MDDHQLLSAYVTERSEAAFAQLVERHRDWVYSTCLRRLANAHQAEDAAQAVFIALAQKGPTLLRHAHLAGWLYQAARFVCSSVKKMEQRRSRHEAEVARMTALSTPDGSAESWAQFAPDLEPALDRLPEKYRLALLLRFYQQKTLSEVASSLRISEPAAQKRVNRGLEKLRGRLKAGAHVPPAILATAMCTHGLHTAPAGISGASVAMHLAAGAGTSFTLSQGALSMMFLAKLKTVAALLFIMVMVIGGGAILSYLIATHEKTALAGVPVPTSASAAADEAAQRDAFISAYIHEDTVMVIHLDATKIDTQATYDAILKSVTSVPQMPAREINLIHLTMDHIKTMGDDFLARFAKAGGRHAYMMIAQSGDNAPHMAAVLFPIEAGGNADALTTALMSIPGMPPVVPLNDHVLAVCDSAQSLDELGKPAADRPDLAAALKQAAGDAQFIIACNDSTRATMLRHLGKGHLEDLINHAQYVSATLMLPPHGGSVLTVQFDTPEHAQAGAESWNAFIDYLIDTAEAHGSGDPFVSGMLDSYKKTHMLVATGHVAQMKLEDASQSATAVAILLPALSKKKGQPGGPVVKAIKQDIAGAMMYAAENNDTWPATIQAAVDKGDLPATAVLSDPTDPDHKPFEYHPWTPDQLKKLDPFTTPVLWQKVEDGKPVVVGYIDGHVQYLPTTQILHEQLDAATAKVK